MSPEWQVTASGAGAREERAPEGLIGLAILAVTISSSLAIWFAGQLPLDFHAFRQSQTALTAYWFTREGYRIIYQTPVLGFPWEVPFEFPLYQYVIAAASQILGIPLTVAGRLVSFAMLLLSVPVAYQINRRLALPAAVFYVLLALVFTSPVYVYWGRAILIETTALLLGLLAIKFWLDDLLGRDSVWRLSLFSAFMTLCMLQKVTTGLPILMFIAAVTCFSEITRWRASGAVPLARWVGRAIIMLLPLIAGIMWTHLTDEVKLANPVGQSFTSAALASWNWGTPAQRISLEFWLNLIVGRVAAGNMGAIFGPFLLGTVLFSTVPIRIKLIAGGALVLGMLPMFLFANLYIVHPYYLCANLIFLLYAMAVAIGAMVLPKCGTRTTVFLTALLMGLNSLSLALDNLGVMTIDFDKRYQSVVLGEILKRDMRTDEQFVMFGADWNAMYALLAERKEFAVTDWFADKEKVLAHPERYVEKGRLGAVLSCSAGWPDAFQLTRWASAFGGWKTADAGNCTVALPERPLSGTPQPGPCLGDIDKAAVEQRGSGRVIAIAGWVAPDTAPPAAAEGAYVTLSRAGGASRSYEMLRVPRLKANEKLGLPQSEDLGVSRLLPADLPPGTYELGLVIEAQGRLTQCPFHRELVIPQ